MSDTKKLKFLCFHLGERLFALDIMGIREILRIQAVTPVPDAPDNILGIVNVRGELITVLDARAVFGIKAEEADRRDVRIIIGVWSGIRFGLLVDLVLDVATVDIDEINPAPTDATVGSVLGLFKRPGDGEGGVVVLLRLAALAKLARGEKQGIPDLDLAAVSLAMETGQMDEHYGDGPEGGAKPPEPTMPGGGG